ncbi:hypothetical protein BOTBODRAFT_190866 [Botryobasidium botryosum FD-172 SS1]|uniref:Sensitive to high expression protein 9, mitochondrial n=1 Tax=Botryobasidium botryosum (strain FD-172 SS1) TaxID=930990 RepID=A0A067MED3_BOTB1|nr:hypothetical protein BOTBODRAFT_190866 [Botryobasidium botryosum FD-172 SS1]
MASMPPQILRLLHTQRVSLFRHPYSSPLCRAPCRPPILSARSFGVSLRIPQDKHPPSASPELTHKVQESDKPIQLPASTGSPPPAPPNEPPNPHEGEGSPAQEPRTDTIPLGEPQSQSTPPEARSHEESRVGQMLGLWGQEAAVVRDRLKMGWHINSALLRERVHSLSGATRARLGQVGGKLNQVTGYDEIEELKRHVVEKENRIEMLREEAKDAKKAYENAVAQRSSLQREVNDLLQRKAIWNDADVSRYTVLVTQDHQHGLAEVRTKEAFALAEQEVEKEFNELMRAILNRYHEEQMWSDKIRSASTYGSLAALGLNLVVFILAIVLVEPWKRKRLAQTFERKIVEMSRENQAMIDNGMATLNEHFERQEAVLQTLALAASKPSPQDPENSPIPLPPPIPTVDPPLPLPLPSPIPLPIDDAPAFDKRKYTFWAPDAVSDRDLAIGVAGTLGGFVLGWFLGGR